MLYIVIAIERHPDSGISDTYGPFDSYDEADTFAKFMDSHKSNDLGNGHKRDRFVSYPLTKPQDA